MTIKALAIINRKGEIVFSKCQPGITKLIFSGFISEFASNYLNIVPPEVGRVVSKNLNDCGQIILPLSLLSNFIKLSLTEKNSITNKCGSLFVVEALDELHKGLTALLGGITQHSLTDNVVLIREYVEEILVCGILQSQPFHKIQSQLYSRPSIVKRTALTAEGLFGLHQKPTEIAKSLHKEIKKEIYVDVHEHVTAQLLNSGQWKAEACGSVTVKSYFSETLQLTVHLNSSLFSYGEDGCFTDLDFGSDIDTCDLKDKRQLKLFASFGEKQVVNYSLSTTRLSFLPFFIESCVKPLSESDVEVYIKLCNTMSPNAVAPFVTIKFSVPFSTTSVMSRSNGPENRQVSFLSDEKVVLWTLENFGGSSTAETFIRVINCGRDVKFEKAYIEFEVSKWVPSGLRIERLVVTPLVDGLKKWVRYLTVSENVEFAIN